MNTNSMHAHLDDYKTHNNDKLIFTLINYNLSIIVAFNHQCVDIGQLMGITVRLL